LGEQGSSQDNVLLGRIVLRPRIFVDPCDGDPLREAVDPFDEHDVEHFPWPGGEDGLIGVGDLLVPYEAFAVPYRRAWGVHQRHGRPACLLQRVAAQVAREKDELEGPG